MKNKLTILRMIVLLILMCCQCNLLCNDRQNDKPAWFMIDVATLSILLWIFLRDRDKLFPNDPTP